MTASNFPAGTKFVLMLQNRDGDWIDYKSYTPGVSSEYDNPIDAVIAAHQSVYCYRNCDVFGTVCIMEGEKNEDITAAGLTVFIHAPGEKPRQMTRVEFDSLTPKIPDKVFGLNAVFQIALLTPQLNLVPCAELFTGEKGQPVANLAAASAMAKFVYSTGYKPAILGAADGSKKPSKAKAPMPSVAHTIFIKNASDSGLKMITPDQVGILNMLGWMQSQRQAA